MAGEMLLINPSSRKRRRVGGKAKRRTTSRRRRNPITARKSVAVRRPMTISRHRRRRNPISNLSRHRRRRRNPIGGFGGRSGGMNMKSFMDMFKDAAVGGAGAIAFDMLMGQINQYLPTSFQTQANTVGTGDAVKALITAAIGQGLNKHTKGWSKKLAEGALTVQAWQIISAFMPSTMQVGWATPARIINGSARVGPSRGGMLQAYQRPGGKTALLNAAGGSSDRMPASYLGAYMSPGRTALLNGTRTAQMREGVSLFK